MPDEQQSEFLNDRDKARMIEHMNADHADAVMNYLRVFARVNQADSALLTDLDRCGMTLVYEREGHRRHCMIPFDPPLQDASEVRETLVQMAVEAREQLQSRTQ
ncbi:MAG: DUF2470 domain-containing protein [Thiogranum sp.]